jgi:outer membrane protein OmpA-like peptidoglycan-associated protein
MRLLIAPVIFLCCSVWTQAQSLLLNGGFEDINICPEFRAECAPEAWISSGNTLANYFKDAETAKTGVNCMAIEAGRFGKSGHRTFLRTRLLCGLRAGSKYRLSFWADSPHPILDSVGFRFSAADPLFEKNAQQTFQPSGMLAATVNEKNYFHDQWYYFQVDYTANGTEVYFSFAYYAQEEYNGDRVHPLEDRYLIYFDDISLIPLNPAEQLCRGWQQAREEIYDEDERHHLLEKKIKEGKRRPPPSPTLVTTAFVRVDTLLLPDILFTTGRAVLQPQSFPLLDKLAASAKGKEIDSLVVNGHTDNTGTAELNRRLSLDRANVAANYLKGRMKNAGPFFTYGFADTQPVADNATPEGRQKNRRVEIYLYLRE